MKPDGWYYVSGPRFTVALRLVNGLVVDGPPVVRKRWIGRPLTALVQAWSADRVVEL